MATDTTTQTTLRAALQRARPRLRQRGFLAELAEGVVLIVLIYTLVNLASARYVVDGASMSPNFATGQFIIVSRANYLFGTPDYGQVVVFHYPNNPKTDYIKRVIGLPGDVIELRDQQLYVNGVTQHEPYVNEPCGPAQCRDNNWTLGPTEYFVMGDNRNHSMDSRSFGPVDRRFIVGEALVRYWPLTDLAWVQRYRAPD